MQHFECLSDVTFRFRRESAHLTRLTLRKPPLPSLFKHRVQRKIQTIDRTDLQAFDRRFRRIGTGNNGAGKAEFGRLAQTFLSPGGRADFAGEPHFAENHGSATNRFVTNTGKNSSQQGQIHGGFGNFDPADSIDKNVLIKTGYACVTVQYRQEHGQSLRVDPDGETSRRRQMRGID